MINNGVAGEDAANSAAIEEKSFLLGVSRKTSTSYQHKQALFSCIIIRTFNAASNTKNIIIFSVLGFMAQFSYIDP